MSMIDEEKAKSTYTPLNAHSYASVDTREDYLKQVALQAEEVANNPEIKDTSRVQEILSGIEVPEGTYISASEVDEAMRNGYRVTSSTDAYGNKTYYRSGVQRVAQDGTSGAAEAHLSDAAYIYKMQAGEEWAALQEQIQAALQAGDTALAESLKQKQQELHNNVQTLYYANGFLGGLDGSMYIPASHIEPGGTAGLGNYNYYDPQKSTSSSRVNDYSQYLKDMYAAKMDAAIAALDASYQQNLASINRAGAGLSEAYQDARNQTAGASEITKRNMAQYAAANGLNSGTGGQAELTRNVTLQNNLNSINSQEAQSLADLELQRANAEIEYNTAIAQAQAEGNYELANALYQEQIRYDNAMTAAIQQEYENALTEYQLGYQAYRDSVADAQQDWQNKFTETQYNDALEQQDWENTFKQKQYDNSLIQAGSSTATDDTTKPALTYAQVMDAVEKGNLTPNVLSAFEYYNGISYDGYSAQIQMEQNAPIVDATLTAMQQGGANLTELRAALRDAYYGGGLTETDYKALHAKYLGDWSA